MQDRCFQIHPLWGVLDGELVSLRGGRAKTGDVNTLFTFSRRHVNLAWEGHGKREAVFYPNVGLFM